jgi:site-specific recombinase XerD
MRLLRLPAAANAGEETMQRYTEFFTANIHNPHTRRAYARACNRFFAWCDGRALTLADIQSPDVTAWMKQLQLEHSPASVKQQLAAVRMLFDWLVARQVMSANPASAVRGPRDVVRTGRTAVLNATQWRRLIDTIPTDTVRALRDRALIATLTYSFARVTAVLQLRVDDFRPLEVGWVLRLHERGGKHHTVPCHHEMAAALRSYIDAAGIADDPKGCLFRTSRGHAGTMLSARPMTQSDTWRMIRRRAAMAGIHAPIGNHTFRATGITAYLGSGGALGHAQSMAAHESPRTTRRYDPLNQRATRDEVDRIRF